MKRGTLVACGKLKKWKSDMFRIIPAILTVEPAELEREITAIAPVAELIQIDVGDGIFVSQKTIGPKDLAKVKSNCFYEMHLMTVEPEAEVEKWSAVPNIKTVVFHFEATADPEVVIQKIKQYGYEVALAFNPQTPTAEAVKWAEKVDKIVFLSVTPGRQGQSFAPEVWDKVREFKKARPRTILEIDGGLHEAEIKKAAALGVEDMAVGSEIFQSVDPARRWRELQNILDHQQ